MLLLLTFSGEPLEIYFIATLHEVTLMHVSLLNETFMKSLGVFTNEITTFSESNSLALTCLESTDENNRTLCFQC